MASLLESYICPGHLAACQYCVTCRAIAEVLQYKHCTAVQAESLGPLLTGADMVVKAKTGTGKTLAFLIPGVEQVLLPMLFTHASCSLSGPQ